VRRALVILGILSRSALRGLQSSSVTSAIAVVTITISLVLVGAFALLVGNMQGLLDRFGEDLRITAYLEEGLEPQAQRELASRVATVEGVEAVQLVTKAEALERFRSRRGGAALLEGLEGNPLPSSLDITLLSEFRTPEGLAILQSSLDGLPGVEEVAHGQEWIEGYARIASLVRTSGYVLGGVLALATLLIVANTIRLGVYAREDELDILDLVGASRTFVRVPFLLEGTLQGALGGVAALVLLWASFHLIVPQLQYGLSFLLGDTMPRFFEAGEMVRLLIGGAGLGLMGSAAALLGGRSA
jgi:cell division transport system permease protein